MPLSGFHPAVRAWFAERIGAPSAPQRQGWPEIAAGRHVLVAAPTGTGKTLAAFLSALDTLLRQGDRLGDATRVLYVSPLKALSNDVAKNLLGPLAELRARDPSLPEVRVLVRTGDTPQKDRAAMLRRPPHVLVTTPESLYILLTSDGGRRLLRTVETAIVDEIHALAPNKRGAHLALSLERLDALRARDGQAPVQRIGLSATQKPLEDIARFLVGARTAMATVAAAAAEPMRDGDGAPLKVVDAGHLRHLDLGVELPPSPLAAVCSHEVWDEVYARLATLIQQHTTTLVFVNTRKMAERISARLKERLGEDVVRCHHGSLSREIRLDAETRLKDGRLRALVATASLELGIDIGDVDLAVQVGAARSIAVFLQRMGRAGHGPGRTPKGRLFPLTRDELVEAAALLRAVKLGELDRIELPSQPLDILAQQIVAECVAAGDEGLGEDALFASFGNAWPYRSLSRAAFDDTVNLHVNGRAALLHRDGVNGRLRATRRARLRAVTNGGAIPDVGDYRVLLEPEGTFIGTLNEDFAVESDRGDIVQLGTTSWRILRIEPGIVRVADAHGAPPTLPFWLGEGPGRTRELSAAISQLREESPGRDELVALGLPPEGAEQIAEYFAESRRVLGVLPTCERLVAERFFDEGGGTQIVLHAPFGSRINRAFGLALRKRICTGFGYELQAAANEEAIVFSLGEKPGVPLDDVFTLLHPRTARDVLVQAVLATPFFEARWRWNTTRALLVERMRGGKPIPLLIQRMRATDLLADAFPHAVACPETLASPILDVPEDHPLVRQTMHDCLNEVMDVDGMLRVLQALHDGTIATRVVDTAQPSPLAHEILNARPYAFLDDAPLEERRTRAVMMGGRGVRGAADDGADPSDLDPAAAARVAAEAWPDPRSADEVHEALCWMGFVTEREAGPWRAWLDDLLAAGRVQRDAVHPQRWFATEATRDEKAVLRGRLEALGPVYLPDAADAPPVEPFGDAHARSLLDELIAEGVAREVRLDGRAGVCDRRLLQRICRLTLDRLRREIEPVAAADFLRFLACWQHVEPSHRLDGPAGVAEVVTQLSGFEAKAREWEKSLLPQRVNGYRREWLDEAMLSGAVAWGRLFGGARLALKATPLCLVPRADLETWKRMAEPVDAAALSAEAVAVLEALERGGALFAAELQQRANLLQEPMERGVAELIAHGAVTADSFAALRRLMLPVDRRRGPMQVAGRFSLLRARGQDAAAANGNATPSAGDVEFVARQLLRRTGVVFRRTVLRERIPVAWRDLLRVYRTLELRGEVRGGRFVAGFDGEQYALPGAVTLLRSVRKRADLAPIAVSAADPLNFRGILTPDERVAATSRSTVLVG